MSGEKFGGHVSVTSDIGIDGTILRSMMSDFGLGLSFAFADLENAHIGPRHRPGRNELAAVRHHEQWVTYVRSLGRPAGPYCRRLQASATPTPGAQQ